MSNTLICTWFVADDKSTASYFPQIGGSSDAPETQAIYWRCVAGFFASSKLVNPQARHLFFCNVPPPNIDGRSIMETLAALGVEVVRLDITYRLRRPDFSMFGNQFYILDILNYLARNEAGNEPVFVLDSDCVWLRPVDPMARRTREVGVLTYELGEDEAGEHHKINGCSRAELAQVAFQFSGFRGNRVAYCGGEIFAGTGDEIRRLARQIGPLWELVADMPDNPIREEAHFLSVLFAANGYAALTGNPFIRRIWTSLRHYNARPDDEKLTIWHLPAEKRTGFRSLFNALPTGPLSTRALEAAGWGPPRYSRLFGVPRRSAGKLAASLADKVRQRISRALASFRGRRAA